MSVCHAPSNCFFFFVSRWNRAILGPSVLRDPLYKTFFLDFWFRPPDAQNLLPKICTKSTITRLVWQIDRRCLEPCKMLWDRPLLPWQRNFGLGADIHTPTGLSWCYIYSPSSWLCVIRDLMFGVSCFVDSSECIYVCIWPVYPFVIHKQNSYVGYISDWLLVKSVNDWKNLTQGSDN